MGSQVEQKLASLVTASEVSSLTDVTYSERGQAGAGGSERTIATAEPAVDGGALGAGGGYEPSASDGDSTSDDHSTDASRNASRNASDDNSSESLTLEFYP